jgi:hypothetical protein
VSLVKRIRNWWRRLMARRAGLDAYEDVDGVVRWARSIRKGQAVRVPPELLARASERHHRERSPHLH